MKILFDHPDPFLLGHGGVQRQIECSKAALERLGVEVEFLRWWDERQTGDLIHFFGKATPTYLRQASIRGLPVVMTSFFSDTCNRPKARLRRQALVSRALMKMAGESHVQDLLGWRRYHDCAHNVVGLRAEQFVLEYVYRVPPERISTVPLGVANVFLTAGKAKARGDHLITTGTINPIKRSVELAQAARAAGVPLLFVGRPYSEQSGYWKRFQELIDGQCVRHRPHVESSQEMAAFLQQARGFVIFSQFENWCLSAHEAAAVGLPLLLPDLPWSRERFGAAANYFSDAASVSARLREFYEAAVSLPPPAVSIPGWENTGAQLKAIYEYHVARRK